MGSKTCSKCGWVYPSSTSLRKCKICGGAFKEGNCRLCGEYTDSLLLGYLCRACFNATRNTPGQRNRRAREYRDYGKIYKAWLDKIKSLPPNYPTLTDQQWLEACNHFGGCAYCGSESIDSRAYFIPFKDGGRYCDWNIIPACERCAAASESKQADPFKRYINNNKKPVLNRIVSYLEVRLDRAVEKTTNVIQQSDGATRLNEQDCK